MTFLAGIILIPSIVDNAYAVESGPIFAENFESYAPGTSVPSGWTYDYYIHNPKTPEVEAHNVIQDNADKVYQMNLGAIREWPANGSPGRVTIGNLLSPTMAPHMQDFSLDILGKNFRGDGGESYTGATVGYAIIYETDQEVKSLGVRTHSLNDKNVAFYIIYDGNKTSPNIVLNSLAPFNAVETSTSIGNNTSFDQIQYDSAVPGTWGTFAGNVKSLYNDNGLGDYDSDVVSWTFALVGNSNTSQINNQLNQWEGQYDDVLIESIESVYCGQPESSYNRIDGTESSDILTGTDSADLIFGYGGHDLILGKGGNDCIFGGNGADLIKSGGGNDTIYGGGGSDYIKLGSGTNFAYGEAGLDILYSQSGSDTLDGGPGSPRDICTSNSAATTFVNCEVTDKP